jgi:hypothetical protein
MKIEVGKKYTDGSSIVDIKFIDYENCAWGLDQILRSRFIESRNVDRWQEVIDKPDPGEGWRLLHPEEDLEAGDEFWSQSEQTWIPSLRSQTIQCNGWYYRRRTTPQYVPYTWDDREELRDRWFKQKGDVSYERKVCNIEVEKSELFIDGWEAKEFLQKCVWLDGSPCGKRVV